MAFVSLEEMKKQAGFNRRRSQSCSRIPDDCVRISKNIRSQSKNGPKTDNFRISIGKGVEKASRIMLGDKIDFLFDKEANLVMLRRVGSSGGGYQLSYSGGKPEPGKHRILNVKFPVVEGMPIPPDKAMDIQATIGDSGEIVFELDRETKCKREDV